MKKNHLLCLVGLVLPLLVTAQDTTRVSLLFVGDIMGHDSQIASAHDAQTGTYDYTKGFRFLQPYIASADVAIGNLEVTLAGPPYTGYPRFSSPDELAASLKEIGFDVLVTANNHSADRGKKGIIRTIRVLDSLQIAHTGTFADEVGRANDYPLMLDKNGIRIALLNYTYGTNGLPVPKPTIVNPLDTALIGADVLKARGQHPDVVIAFVHWGVEYENLPRREQQQVTAYCFSKGVDMVIGSHPHVLQPMIYEKEHDRLAVYSLGNFVSGQRKRYTDGGAMAYLELEKIRWSPDSIDTRIDSTGYVLQWVYRTADEKKDYYVLPVPSFESNPRSFIRDEASRQAFTTFIADSRALYSRHNRGVEEIRVAPPAPLPRYKVMIPIDEAGGGATPGQLKEAYDLFFGYELVSVPDQGMQLLLGNFDTARAANVLCETLRAEGHPATVVVDRD